MASKGTCEDGCKAQDVWVDVRRGFVLLCDDCAHRNGVLFRERVTK